MNEPTDKDDLIERFKAGDKDAANELMQQHLDRAVRAARNRIKNRRLRGTNSEDIAMSAFESLWRKADQQDFRENDLISVDEFWRLLCTIIKFKTEDHLRRENADKRGGGNLRGESIFIDPNEQFKGGIDNNVGSEFSGEALAHFKERHQKLMDMLSDAELQEIATMRIEDYKVTEIAEHFDRSDRWVKRKLALIREIWQTEIDPDEDL